MELFENALHTGGIWKRGLFVFMWTETFWKRIFLKTLFKPEAYVNTGFPFWVGRKNFFEKTELFKNNGVKIIKWFPWPSFLQTQIQNDRSVPECCVLIEDVRVLRIFTAHANSHATLNIQYHRARAIGQMAIAIALPGFNDLERSVAPTFFSWILFSTNFPCFFKKKTKSIDQKFEFFCTMHHRTPFYSALRLSVRLFQIPLEGLSFLKTLATFGNFFLQQTHFYKIWLRSFASVDSPSLFWTIHLL